MDHLPPMCTYIGIDGRLAAALVRGGGRGAVGARRRRRWVDDKRVRQRQGQPLVPLFTFCVVCLSFFEPATRLLRTSVLPACRALNGHGIWREIHFFFLIAHKTPREETKSALEPR